MAEIMFTVYAVLCAFHVILFGWLFPLTATWSGVGESFVPFQAWTECQEK